VSVLEGPADRLDEGVRHADEEILPQARQLSGFKGVVSLLDRGSGRTKLITLWESADALRSSEEQATELRQRAAEGAAGHIVGVERYEVGIARVPAVAVS
jgi:heme-degrading monooxygenase HmoA